MEVKRISLDKLKGASYNPKGRTAVKKVQQLRKSIERVGLLSPILITKDCDVVDGHRRISVASELGWKDIPTIVVSVESAEEAYAEVNAATAKITGNELLQVWLSNPKAVTGTSQRRFEVAEGFVGRPMMAKLAKQGFSLSVFRCARGIAAYVDRPDDHKFISKAVWWLANFRNQRTIGAYMTTRKPSKTLHDAIMAARDLKVLFI